MPIALGGGTLTTARNKPGRMCCYRHFSTLDDTAVRDVFYLIKSGPSAGYDHLQTPYSDDLDESYTHKRVDLDAREACLLDGNLATFYRHRPVNGADTCASVCGTDLHGNAVCNSDLFSTTPIAGVKHPFTKRSIISNTLSLLRERAGSMKTAIVKTDNFSYQHRIPSDKKSLRNYPIDSTLTYAEGRLLLIADTMAIENVSITCVCMCVCVCVCVHVCDTFLKILFQTNFIIIVHQRSDSCFSRNQQQSVWCSCVVCTVRVSIQKRIVVCQGIHVPRLPLVAELFCVYSDTTMERISSCAQPS